MSEPQITIGERLSMVREEQGISQAELAARTGIYASNISRIESGKFATRIDIVERIADALGYRIELVRK